VLTKKIALAAGALTLAAGGVAAAAGSPPEEAETGLTIAEAQVGTDLPASQDAHPGGPEDVEAEDIEAEELEVEEAEVEEDGEGGPTDNHGAVVSAVAQSDEHEGREHGEAVSTAARANHGAEASAAASAGEGDDDTDDEADEDGDSEGAEGAAKARG